MKIKCPNCQNEVEIPDGTPKFFCPNCGTNLINTEADASAPVKPVQIAFPSNSKRKCPYCQKDVDANAVVCPYCHNTFVSTHQGKNAIGMIIIFVVSFLILFYVLSAFTDCEADRQMAKSEVKAEKMVDKWQQKSEQEVQRMMRNMPRY